MTLDALTARANTGSVHVGPGTMIILDEAGVVDHKRLDALTELIERSGAKLVTVGDGKQFPSVGPGGMFDWLTGHAPTDWSRSTAQPIHRSSERGKHAGRCFTPRFPRDGCSSKRDEPHVADAR